METTTRVWQRIAERSTTLKGSCGLRNIATLEMAHVSHSHHWPHPTDSAPWSRTVIVLLLTTNSMV